MYRLINFTEFVDSFKKMDRDNFSYEGYTALWEHLQECESDDVGIQFDVIGLDCEFTEYESFDDFEKEYSDLCEDEDIRCIDDIADHTTVIHLVDYFEEKKTGGFIINSNF